MILARVEGKVVSTQKHPSLRGQKIIICQPINPDGSDCGVPWLAIDPLGANLHQRVVVSTDGSATRTEVNDPKSPLRNIIVGIMDDDGKEDAQ